MNYIISAASKVTINEKEAILRCHRHVDIHDLAHQMKNYVNIKVVEEGFLDANEVFHNRRDAFTIANNANQIQFADDNEREWQILYSEFLW